MRTGVVVENDEHGNKVVGNEVVKTLHTDRLDPMKNFNGDQAGKIAVAYNGLRSYA